MHRLDPENDIYNNSVLQPSEMTAKKKNWKCG